MKPRSLPALVVLLGLSAAAWAATQEGAAPKAAAAPAKAPAPRLKEPEVTLLPNGWRISPVGQHFTVGDLPMNLVVSPDGDHVIVTNNGYSQPNLVVTTTRSRRPGLRGDEPGRGGSSPRPSLERDRVEIGARPPLEDASAGPRGLAEARSRRGRG